MANHKSALKRIRSNEAKRLRNKYQHKTARNAVRDLRTSEDKKEAEDHTSRKRTQNWPTLTAIQIE